MNDFWKDGGLNVLSSLVRYSAELPAGFVTHLLEVRLAMAPAYTQPRPSSMNLRDRPDPAGQLLSPV